MARYNPKNLQHRKNLAKRLFKMLEASGFSRAAGDGEVIYDRPVDGYPARVRVFTSCGQYAARTSGTDAIRICAVYDIADETRGLVKSTRINRTGEMDGITGRTLNAMRKTYKIALKRAKNPSFLASPLWIDKHERLQEAIDEVAAIQTPEPVQEPSEAPFKVGDLVVSSRVEVGTDLMDPEVRILERGIIKEIHTEFARLVSVFWLTSGTIGTIDVDALRLLKA